jgi:hypothetical protein
VAGHLGLGTVAIRQGDRARRDQHFVDLRHVAHDRSYRYADELLGPVEVWDAVAAGQFTNATETATRLLANDPDPGGAIVYHSVLAAVRTFTDGDISWIDSMVPFVDANPVMAMMFRPAIAVLRATTGRTQDAARLIDDCLRPGGLVPYANRAYALTFLAEAAGRIDDCERARSIETLLAPYAGQVVAAFQTTPVGAVDSYLGFLAVTQDRHDKGRRLLDAGAQLEDRIGAHFYAARTRTWLASSLLESMDDADHDRARRLLEETASFAAAVGARPLLAEARVLIDRTA